MIVRLIWKIKKYFDRSLIETTIDSIVHVVLLICKSGAWSDGAPASGPGRGVRGVARGRPGKGAPETTAARRAATETASVRHAETGGASQEVAGKNTTDNVLEHFYFCNNLQESHVDR